MKFYKIGFLLVLFITKVVSQDLTTEKINSYSEVADKIVKYALDKEQGYALLKEFCMFGPRLSGSENSIKSIYWTEKKMKEMGFDNVTLQPVMVPKWVRGNQEKCFISQSNFFKNRKLSIGSLGGSIPTPQKGTESTIIEVKSFDELNALGEKVQGKIVFFNRPMEKSEINTFAAYSKAVEQRSVGAINAAKKGAVGVIVRSVTTKHDNNPHLGTVNYISNVEKIPAVAIGLQDADFLSEAIKKEPSLKIKIQLNCKTYPDAQSFNVLCDVTGSEKPDEIIVLAGHSDSWDAGDGAHDNAAGCMHSLEAVNILKALNLKPKRTIRCAFIINEENGLRGGIEYGKYSDTAAVKHIAAIESDRGSGSPIGFSTNADSIKINKMISWLPILRKANIEWVRKGGGGADISKIKTDVLIGYTPESQRYFDYHHSANDIISEVHPREFELGAASMAILAYLISQEGY
jgi:carboxypeptidase Q